MKNSSAADAYKLSRFESAPPLKIVQLMYEGSLRFLTQAEAALEAGDPGRFAERCLRAQAVISELRLSLESQHAPELVEKLESLYLFAEAQIRAAILDGKKEPLASVRGTLTTLLEGWNQLEVGR